MQVLTWLNDVLLIIADPCLDWLLLLERDLALVLICVATALGMTLVRRWTTDQDLLRRCHQDKQRLKALMRTARAAKDKEALGRYRATLGLIATKTMTAEFRPLLWVILPIAVLGTWAVNRFSFYALRTGEPVEIVAYFPVSDSGELACLVPQKNLEVIPAKDGGGWLREIREQQLTPRERERGEPLHGVASWHVRARSAPGRYRLKLRHRDRTYAFDLLVGGHTYAPPVTGFSLTAAVPAVEVRLRKYKPLGLVPDIERIMCPGWLLAYFVIAVSLVFAFKAMLKIY